jgi:hypothetical protein
MTRQVFVDLVVKFEARNIAQRYAVFCANLSGIATITYEKLQQAFGDYAVSRAPDFPWHNMFSEGRTLVEDEQRSGRPSATRTGHDTARVR